MSFRAQRPPERRHGKLLFYRGSRAHVLFGDASSSMPAAPFQRLGIAPGEAFVVIADRLTDGQLRRARIERVLPVRAPNARLTTPPVYVRDGRRLTSRRRVILGEVSTAIAELAHLLALGRDPNILGVFDEWEEGRAVLVVLALDPARVQVGPLRRGFEVRVRKGSPIVPIGAH